MKKYLLPCNCGQNVEVDAGQAGLQVSCACGATLDVPTMRGLSQLRPAETPQAETASTPQAAWGPGQGLMFLGAVFGILGLIALLLVLQQRPQWVVQPQQIAINIHRQTPEQLWYYWLDLRKGLQEGEDPVRQRFENEWAAYRRHRTMALIPLVIGILMLLGGLALVALGGPRGQPAPQVSKA
jgi:hypothetical protein